MKLLEILKKILCCEAPETSAKNDVLGRPSISLNKASVSLAAVDDIRIVVGDNTLSLVYDACLGGLHNALSYDPCSGALQDCFSELNTIIGENLEEVYDSIIVKTGENQYLLNIVVNLLVGAGKLFPKLCEDLIDVFYPVIKKFIDNNIVDNKVGIYSAFTDAGTSLGLFALMRHLKQDGYMCCGVVATIKGYSLERTKVLYDFSYVDVEKLAKDNEDFDIRNLPSLLHNEVVGKMHEKVVSIMDENKEDETCFFAKKLNGDIDDLIYRPFSDEYWYLWYKGQCRTFADIIATLNETKHYSEISELLQDFSTVMDEYKQRGTVDADAVAAFSSMLSDEIFSRKLFRKGQLNLNIFRGFTLHQFIAKSSARLEEIYRYRASSKIFILVKTLNDICHYTDIQQFKEDFLGIVSGQMFYESDNHVMDDPIYFGNWPIGWFMSGIRRQWARMLKDGTLSSELMYKVMFEEHERKVVKYGLERVLKDDFEAQGPCHPEVFYPKEIGTAPIYVKDETSRKYLIACGEGKGPRSGHECYEMALVKLILDREVKQGKYVFINGMYIPVGTVDKPIFVEYFGRLHFPSKEAKNQFINQHIATS